MKDDIAGNRGLLAGRRVALCCRETGLNAAISAVLTREGCAVCDCEDAESRVDDLLAAAPDVIVIEAASRDSQALAICQSVRREARLAGARMLVLLDTGRSVARRRAEALGAHGVLALPVGMDALREEIRRLVGGA